MTATRDRILFACLILDLLSRMYALDDIYISAVNHTGPMIEGNQYELQCDIYNVAPLQTLTVNWYKGETLVDQTSFTDTIKSPVKTATLLIHPKRDDDGAQFRCEAVQQGPQSLPKVTSDPLNITVYYTSISIVNHIGPMMESKQYHLQCDIHNVASKQNLTVNWYRGETPLNETSFNVTIKSPVIKTATLLFRPNRHDDGAQFRCEAVLKLGEEGPQSPSNVTSDSLNITVYFKPTINETNLPSIVYVTQGTKKMICCIADGNPRPTISWSTSTNMDNDGKFTITESTPKNINCTASNAAGSATKSVKVEFIDDYLPLLAGLVAITVAFISVIFVFIYSIYYKTSKMGRYSLKDAKLSAQNGNIAQNGKDNTIPMKKLSQSNILA